MQEGGMAVPPMYPLGWNPVAGVNENHGQPEAKTQTFELVVPTAQRCDLGVQHKTMVGRKIVHPIPNLSHVAINFCSASAQPFVLSRSEASSEIHFRDNTGRCEGNHAFETWIQKVWQRLRKKAHVNVQ
jgi:hypothetical protein